MMRQSLFTVSPARSYQTLVLSDFQKWQALSKAINRHSLIGRWTRLDLRFEQADVENELVPDIASVYLPGVLAFRASLKSALFPAPCCALEFLPICVGHEEWYMLNCLKTTRLYDRDASLMMRGLDQQVFLVQKLFVNDSSIGECGVFTIEDSNRGQLFMLASMVRTVKRLKLRGLDFENIGSYSPTDAKGSGSHSI